MRLKKVREGEIKGKSGRKGVVEITAGCDRRTAEAHGEEAGAVGIRPNRTETAKFAVGGTTHAAAICKIKKFLVILQTHCSLLRDRPEARLSRRIGSA